MILGIISFVPAHLSFLAPWSIAVFMSCMRSMGTVQTGIHYYTTRQDDNHDANGERHLVDCRRIPSLRVLPSSLVCADMDASQTLWQPIRNSWLFGLTWPHTPQRRLFYKPFVFVGPRRCTVCRPVKLIYFINEYQSIIGFSFFGQHACSCSNDRFYHSHFAEHFFTGWIRLFYLKFWQSSDSGADLPFRCVRH